MLAQWSTSIDTSVACRLTPGARSTIPRLGEAFHPPDPRDRRPRDQDSLPAASDMDWCHSPDFPGHVTDAPLRHRVLW
jgi:hypothetical protein